MNPIEAANDLGLLDMAMTALDGAHTFKVIVGTAGDDDLSGGDGGDKIKGLDGNDFIQAKSGADVVFGGRGSDSLYGGGLFFDPNDGADTLHGDAGNDALYGNVGDDLLFGGSGDDGLDGGVGDDRLDGGSGHHDLANIHLQPGDVGVSFDASSFKAGKVCQLDEGAAGVDTFVGIESLHIFGTELGDTLVGSRGDDTITGGDGLYITGGDDVIDAGNGDDVIGVTDGDSTVQGGAGDDTIALIWGDGAHDVFDGGKGFDTVELTGVFDNSGMTVTLTDGTLTASTANAAMSVAGTHIEAISVIGGSSGDHLSGGAADDSFSGQSGADTLTGGAGSDTFAYDRTIQSIADAPDLITDLGDGDIIDLASIDADITTTGDQAFEVVHRFTGQAGQLFLFYDSADDVTKIQADTDGDGKADLVILASGDHHDFAGFAL